MSAPGKPPRWALLVGLALLLAAPLVAAIISRVLASAPPPANPATTPNPTSAPWYLFGASEALVYVDPFLAGVVLPGLALAMPATGMALIAFYVWRTRRR